MCSDNGITQLQLQLLNSLVSIYGDAVDLLSLGASTGIARKWLADNDLKISVLRGAYPFLAYLNAIMWYGGSAVLCNKLRLIDRFYFPIRTPLPRSWINRYHIIVCYYPWGHRLLRLERAAGKVVANLADIMADRHERMGARRWISITAKEENAIFHSGARCVAVSQSDAEEFNQLYGVRPEVMNFVPPDHAKLMELALQVRSPCVGFLGAPSFVNEEIMRILAHPEFLSCLSRKGVELIVAGGICRTVDPALLRVIEEGGGRVLGRIPSTIDFYRQVSVTLNPVGPSTGVKIKSIESLIAGKVLITTRWGVDPDLASSFPGQVVYTDWPVDPSTLGDLAIQATQSSVAAPSFAAKEYVEKSQKCLQGLHIR